VANWLEISTDLSVNLDHVKGIARDGERSTLYIELAEGLSEISANLDFDTLKKVLSKRSSAQIDRKVDEIIKNTRTLARSAYTPTP